MPSLPPLSLPLLHSSLPPTSLLLLLLPLLLLLFPLLLLLPQPRPFHQSPQRPACLPYNHTTRPVFIYVILVIHKQQQQARLTFIDRDGDEVMRELGRGVGWKGERGMKGVSEWLREESCTSPAEVEGCQSRMSRKEEEEEEEEEEEKEEQDEQE
ncbi:hypothetical protein Pmani_036834 [Petrolisthes manimaculis]|uniref:Uncharacterized protein n=1 Tax=Petrolisthes manimaculis TaxID=1843537 RepID=A0AAE1NJQ6_9EUCA|nr:hypothetical protein Pmani_036834 [Petrolisthes manimaculis]